MKKAVLITPKAEHIPHWTDVDYIGIDAGALRILEAGLPIQFAVGDFDSMSLHEYLQLKNITTIYKHPVEKNETDSELAVRLCVDMGYRSLILWGGLSGRLDHTLSNIQLLLYRYTPLILMDAHQKVQLLRPGTYYMSNGYKHLSFFAIEPSEMSARGVHYPMDHQSITVRDMFMVSNSFSAAEACIIIHKGCVLCVQTNYK